MSAADDLAKALAAAIGENDEQSTVTNFINTGFAPLNFALSGKWDGGFPVGRIVELFGPSSSGKTALATMAMIAAQRQKGVAMFMDHERSFQQPLAEKLGLNTKSHFVFKKPRTFEESVTLAMKAGEAIRKGKLLPEEAPIVAVFDSLASMVPQSKLFDKDGKERSVETYNMNDNTALARATSGALNAMNQMCEELGICAIFLNQIRTKIGVMYGDPTTTPGGDAPKYYASTRIQLGASRLMDGKGPEAKMIGQEVRARVIKNKVYRPFLVADWDFLFQPDGTGKLHVARSLVKFLAKEKLLEKDGNYLVWEGKKYYPGQLGDKLDNADGIKALEALLPAVHEPEVEIVATEAA
jgi:protein RecA